MKNVRIFMALFLVSSFLGALAQEKEAPAKTNRQLAEEFVNLLIQKEHDKAVAHFDVNMQKAMSAFKLRLAWWNNTFRYGDVEKIVEMKEQRLSGYRIVLVTCQFKKKRLDIKVVFDAAQKIAGLFFLPSYQEPLYAKKDSFEEREVSIGSGEWTLPGTFSLPKGESPVAALILLHGSGPMDRDETVGPNRPFQDLAWGLASRGIAVLRYDKRSMVHGEKLSNMRILQNFTVQDEYLDDAMAAVTFLKEEKRIDPKKIFFLGHSLGGMVLPRVAAKASPAGIIVMAGPTRPLEDLIEEQTLYIFSLDGKINAEEKKKLDEVKAIVAEIRNLSVQPQPAGKLLLGACPKYWLDLQGYRPQETLKAMDIRALILQGKRDYQVTVADFEGWKKSLAEKEEVSFKLYPELNHLFIPGKGKSVPAEYQLPGNVPEYVIEDIARWIGK